MSLLERVRAARRFDPAAYLRFCAVGAELGWVRPDHAERLAAWPQLFSIDGASIRLAAHLDTPERCSAALAAVLRQLADEGYLQGWRDELYAVTRAFGEPPLFHLERAAARLFGVGTYAVHVNGVVGAGRACRMWIARRSRTKSVDPGMLDNLVGGGLAAGLTVAQTLLKEGWEEAGILPDPMSRAAACGRVALLREVPEGVQAETIFMHDLELPEEFRPVNQDGEVAQFRLLPVAEVLRLLGESADVALDASLVMLSFMVRHGYLAQDDPASLELARLAAE
jgi:8-oxo-dGTP pyrophosphatase MutT (NUDIX family)